MKVTFAIKIELLQVKILDCVQVKTFKTIWRNVADNLDKYVTFPKLIGGETDWEWRKAVCRLFIDLFGSDNEGKLKYNWETFFSS